MDWSSSTEEDGSAAIGAMDWSSSMEEDVPDSIGDWQWSSKMEEDVRVVAATNIQAVVRGFNVRRGEPLLHLRKIAIVRRELRELQAKAGDPAYIDRICVDVMECRKMTEGIMALLLRLDALQGVHPAVSAIRKSVNREVVQFMEVIDAVVVGAATSPWQDAKNTPNMGRSNSISHLERLSSHSLKRMRSLDNCIHPGPSHKWQDGPTLTSENHHMEVDEEDTSYAGRPDHSLDGASSGPNIDSVSGSCRQEEMDDQSLFETLKTHTAATVIQSSFRGYRVRRSDPLRHLRMIADVRGKLRELTDHVSSPNFHSKLRSDSMERLRMTESITTLLLQLDSVQGVDQEIRDIRKSVTRDVFKLQDLVDKLISDLEIVEKRNALSCNDFESHHNGMSVESSAGEDVVMDSLSRPSAGRESTDDKVGPTHVEFDEQNRKMDLDDDSISPYLKEDYITIELDCSRVTASDNAAASSSSEIAEANQLRDKGSGPCAAIVSGKDVTGGINEERSGTLSTLSSCQRPVEVCDRQPVSEDMSTPKVGNRHWHDKFLDVLHVEARTCKLSDNSSSDDLQARAMDVMQRTLIRDGGFLRDVYDSIMMRSADSPLHSSTPEQEYESRVNEGSTSSNLLCNCVEEIEIHADRAPANMALPDRSICDSPALGDTRGSHQFLIDDYVSGGPGATFRSLSEDIIPAGCAQTEQVDGESDDGISTKARSSTDGSLHESDVTSMNEVVSGTELDGDFGSTDSEDQLVDENDKLKALLNKVLIFAEMQSSMVSAVKETNEKLEAEITRYKKREEVWRKKSKSARRRR